MSTKQELTARLSTLAALKAKLEEMSFSEHEHEILRELLSDEEDSVSRRWLRARAEHAVSLMFPSWRGARLEEAKHPKFHDKSWWWNGASIRSLEERDNGDLVLELSSYVGGGETDSIEDFVLKREWLEADDMAAVIREHCEAEAARREGRRVAQDLANAQAEVAAAQARLAKLQTG
jgi:hypothetical protein